MRKTDVEKIIDALNIIKNYTNKMDFKSSTFINQQLIQIQPILNKELDRLENDNIEINSPKLLLLSTKDLDAEQTLVDLANIRMSELVENNYKIIDFGIYETKMQEMFIFIKYTN